jgi:hypothetical protein
VAVDGGKGSWQFAADAGLAIGEGNGRKFGWEHWR